MLGIEHALVEGVEIVDGAVVARVRLHKRQQMRCSRCRKRCPKHDDGRGRRRWRTLDLGCTKAFLEADAPRVRCREHGVVVAAVTWARAGSGFTLAFEQQASWLAVHASLTTVSDVMRVTWRSVGRILRRVIADQLAGRDLLDGVTRIGIDETSYRRWQRYLTVVVCHDTGRLVWAAPGIGKRVLGRFFDELGAERRAQITHVSCDGAQWIMDSVADRCPGAVVCMDAFHVVKWANDVLDQIRRQVWNDTRKHRRAGRPPKDLPSRARQVKHARWALLKRPENLTERQSATLAELEAAGSPLWQAWLLKEDLRELLALPATDAIPQLHAWLTRADESDLDGFHRIATTIRRLQTQIEAMLTHRLTNGRVESVNAKLRLIQRRAFGFHDPLALIALAKLTLSGLCPPLPGRA